MSGEGWRQLDWDSDHFGFGVACLDVPANEYPRARAALTNARRAGMALVYGTAAPPHEAPAKLLREFAGRWVDCKTTYRRSLTVADRGPVGDAPVIHEYSPGTATPALCALAVLAGTHSRFRVDTRIPTERFEALYTTWMERSTRRELADVVLVASEGAEAGALGMVTVRAQAATGVIGLIAVAERAQGRGLGRRLLQAAHAWMLDRGLGTAMVVTQGANTAACRLYESGGYTRAEAVHYYHFWPCLAPADHP